MIRKIILSAVIATSASAASAELTFGQAFVKYHNFDVDNGTDAKLDVNSLGAGIEYRYNRFTFSGELGSADLEGIDLTTGTVGVEYAFGGGIAAGIDYTMVEIEGIDADVTSIYGAFTTGAYTFGLSIGDFSHLNDTVYSAFAAWDVTPTGTIGLDIVHIEDETLYAAYADYDLAQYNVQADMIKLDELELYSIAGAYDFGNRFSAIGSLSFVDLGVIDARAVTIGAQYEFVEGANVELALGRINVDGAADDVEQVTLGVNYEMGRRTVKRRSIGNIINRSTGSLAGLTDF